MGDPNSGKTRWASDVFANKFVYARADSNNPYDNYAGQRVIIIDDVTPKVSELLHMSNLYTFPARVYGNTRYFEKYMPLNQRIVLIVLTNRTIEETYIRGVELTDGDRKRIDALYARFNVISL